MTISYAIPVCYEHEELRRLLKLLMENKRRQDQVVVQFDLGNTTQEVLKVVHEEFKNQLVSLSYPLNGNFAAFKNNLKAACTSDWVFQIDADEYFDPLFIQNLPEILRQNPQTEVFLLARINTVEGITEEHIKRWRWQVNEKGWINFPDYQPRILQNSVKIQWVNKVHEVLYGHTTYGFLPAEEQYCILHNKNIARQEAQNSLYNNL